MKYVIPAIMATLLILAACAQPVPPTTPGDGGAPSSVATGSDTTADLAGATQELKKFSSVDELKEYLQQSQSAQQNTYYSGSFARTAVMEEAVMTMDMVASTPTAAPSAMKAGGMGSSDGATDYSQTNVQVQGVDEADFVKNDGKYIYDLVGDQLVIVDAYPAEDAAIVSKTHIEGRPRDMFVEGDRLVVFVDRNDYIYTLAAYDVMPRPQYTQQLHVIVYDISDREDPEIADEFTIPGRYLQSRMIENHVYFLVRDSLRMWEYEPQVPAIRNEKGMVLKPEIYYFDNPEENYQFVTVASLDLSSLDVAAKSYLMGYADTVYMSLDSLYVAYQKKLPRRYYEEEKEERFWEGVVPELPSEIRSEVQDAKTSDAAETWSAIKQVLQEYYSGLDEDALQEQLERIDERVQEWEWRRQEERQRTVIHRFTVDDGTVTYVARGEVKGTLLNQFSMDEQEGKLRVATTTNVWSGRGSTSWNNVYVLDEEMEQVGKLERLAEGERIYSTRFLGDILYMVTFKRIDPLFVIDLSNPRRPLLLGELKIPGYSDYLHPMGDKYLIGVGKETKENEWGGVSTKGIKLALFDVRDVTNPELVESVEIGTSGSDSEALNDHKAFLFDDEKDLLVLPVREVKESYTYDGRLCRQGFDCYPYRQRVWQGAYVFTVTEEGFEQRGKIAHSSGDEQYSWYWGSPSAVRRSLFMDEVLYTVSQKRIEMHDIDSIKEINAVTLPYSEPTYDYPRPLPVWEGVSTMGME